MSCVKELSSPGPGPGSGPGPGPGSALCSNPGLSAPPDGYRELSTAELRELLQDEAKMEQIIRLNEKFQELQSERENLLSSNRRLAELSLTQRPHLSSGKLQLCDKYKQLSNLATSCWDKQSQLEARGLQGSVQSALHRLQEEVTQAEEQSEELLEKLMDGLLSVDDFLDQFQRCRKTCHVRRAQVEKLQELGPRGSAPFAPPEENAAPSAPPDQKQDGDPALDPSLRPNGPPVPHGPPLRVFQVRYGLTPAILVPHYPPQAPSGPPPASAVGLRLIGQLPGGWGGGRPVRVQQLYRPCPAQAEPPCR